MSRNHHGDSLGNSRSNQIAIASSPKIMENAGRVTLGIDQLGNLACDFPSAPEVPNPFTPSKENPRALGILDVADAFLHRQGFKELRHEGELSSFVILRRSGLQSDDLPH